MTDTDELRRLAEEALATEDDPEITVDPQAILALLEANEMREAGYRAAAGQWMGRSKAAERRVAALTDGFRASEERVAALEERLSEKWIRGFLLEHLPHSLSIAEDEADLLAPKLSRALLSQSDSVAAAPSEPPTRCEHLDERGRRCIVVGQHQRAAGVIHTYQADPLILEGDPAALPAAPSKPLSEDELRWPFPIADDWTWQGDGPPGQHHGAGDGWAHLHSDGSRWVHPEKVCPAALPAEDDSVAAQALIDSWGGTEDQWGNFYPHEPVSEASDE